MSPLHCVTIFVLFKIQKKKQPRKPQRVAGLNASLGSRNIWGCFQETRSSIRGPRLSIPLFSISISMNSLICPSYCTSICQFLSFPPPYTLGFHVSSRTAIKICGINYFVYVYPYKLGWKGPVVLEMRVWKRFKFCHKTIPSDPVTAGLCFTGNLFIFRRWYRLVQAALIRARRRRSRDVARWEIRAQFFFLK